MENTEEKNVTENVFDEMIKRVDMLVKTEIIPVFTRNEEFTRFLDS